MVEPGHPDMESMEDHSRALDLEGMGDHSSSPDLEGMEVHSSILDSVGVGDVAELLLLGAVSCKERRKQ